MPNALIFINPKKNIMENYYKILGLKVGATLDEVEEKYNKLLKEFDPEKQTDDLKEFFTSERQKVKDAYKEISTSLVDNENIEQVDDEIPSDTNEIDSENEYLEESLAEEVLSDEVIVDNNLNAQINNNKKENYVFRNALLFFIAAGVWGMFMQNMGLFVPSDDYTQKVRVVNTVDTKVEGSVRVNGSVSVDNTVDVNLTQIRGTRPWVNTSRTGAAVLGVFSEETTLQR
jgi:hypothetical protein